VNCCVSVCSLCLVRWCSWPPTTGVGTCPYCALATELTEDTKLRTRLNAARFTRSISASLVGLLLGALLVGYGARATGDGGGRGAVAVGGANPALGLGPGPRAARVCAGLGGGPSRSQAQLGRIRRNAAFLRVVGLYLPCSGSAAI